MGEYNEHEIWAILRAITFAPSCVDMQWDWEVERVETRYQLGSADGYMIRTTFVRPDRDTGEIKKGYGRWWHLPLDPSASAVVKTAYAACRMILEHELMESFKFLGTRPFDPHNDVYDLMKASER